MDLLPGKNFQPNIPATPMASYLDLSILPPPIPPIYITGFGFYMPSFPSADEAHADRGRQAGDDMQAGAREGGEGQKDQTEATEVELASAAAEEEEEEEDPFTQCKGIPLYHFSMINDIDRAQAYNRALVSKIRRLQGDGQRVSDAGDVEGGEGGQISVLDLGCGSGLLAMLAARGGASAVYACDKAPGMAKCAAKVVEANGLANCVRVIPKMSTGLSVGEAPGDDLPRKVDLMVSETFGDDPFSESFLPSLAHAREHLLKAHAPVIPYAIHVYAQAVESQELLELNFVGAAPVCGFDLCSWDLFARPRWSCRLKDHKVTGITEPFHAMTVDWSDASSQVPLSGSATVPVQVVTAGSVHAVVAWYTLLLDKESGAEISTAPSAAAMLGRHWRQAVFFVPREQRRQVECGETMRVHASYLRDRLIFKILDGARAP